MFNMSTADEGKISYLASCQSAMEAGSVTRFHTVYALGLSNLLRIIKHAKRQINEDVLNRPKRKLFS